MKKTLLSTLIICALSASSFAGTAIGINSTGNVYQVSDVTGNESFINNVGISGTFCLGSTRTSNDLFTISGTDLYRFSIGGSASIQRSLPFLVTSSCSAFALDQGGVGYVIDTNTRNLYSFGLVSGNILIGNIGFSSMTTMNFGRDGSLYGIRSTANQADAGLYVISRRDGHATRISTGNFDASNLGGFAEPDGNFSMSSFLTAFNSCQRLSPIVGALSPVGGSTSGIRGLIYENKDTVAQSGTLGIVNFGSVAANTVGCLDDRDGTPLRICRFLVPNLTVPPIQFTVNTGPITSTSTQMGYFYKGRMTAAGNFQDSLEILNVTTGQFDVMNTHPVGLSGHVVSDAIPNSANYLPANRIVTARFKVRPTGLVATQSYCYELDQFVIQSHP